MTRDIEDLILQRYNSADERLKLKERALARIYKEAHVVASLELTKLYAKMGPSINLQEARKYMRLQSLLDNIAKAYKDLTKKSIGIGWDENFASYRDGFYGMTWAIEQAIIDDVQFDPSKVKTSVGWNVLPVEVIEASVLSEHSGLTFIKTFDRNAFVKLADIQATITRGIVLGQSYSKTAKKLEVLFQEGYSDAMRVVRTEAGRNFTEGYLNTVGKAKEAGLDLKNRWVATLDGRTRHTHGVLDGQYEDSEGLFHIGSDSGSGPGLFTLPENSINCRCRLVAEIDGIPETLRLSDGKIQPYVTFEQWASPLGWSSKDGWKKVVRRK